jgi:hypothetical protein
MICYIINSLGKSVSEKCIALLSKDVISQINTKKSLKIPRSNQRQENEEGKTIQWPKNDS